MPIGTGAETHFAETHCDALRRDALPRGTSPRRTAENLDQLQSLLGLDRPAALRVARRKPGLLAQHPQTLRSNLRSIQTSSRVCESTAQLMAETRPGLLLDKVGWTGLTEPSH